MYANNNKDASRMDAEADYVQPWYNRDQTDFTF